MEHKERDHGLIKPDDYIKGPPWVTGKTDFACPHCGCEQTYMINIRIVDFPLSPGPSIGTYAGCPACPWASPMMITPE